MSECSTTKRIKLDDVIETNSVVDATAAVASQPRQFTTISLNKDDIIHHTIAPPTTQQQQQTTNLNKITLMPLTPVTLSSSSSSSAAAVVKTTTTPLTATTTVKITGALSSSPIKQYQQQQQQQSIQMSPVKNSSFIDSLLTKKQSPPSITATQTNCTQPATATATAVVSSSNAAKRILTITSSNGTSISPSAFASSLNGNDKIQYVKIVNSTPPPPLTPSSFAAPTTNVTPSSSSSSSSAIKITPISSSSSSSTQDGTTNARPTITAIVQKPLIQKMTPTQSVQSASPIIIDNKTVGDLNTSLTPVTTSTVSASNNCSSGSSEITMNQNSIEKHNEDKDVNSATTTISSSSSTMVATTTSLPVPPTTTTTTIQLINTPLTGVCLSSSSSQPSKSQVHQRINISSPNKTTTTIIGPSPLIHKMQPMTTAAATSTSTVANYKVLSQQLPQTSTTQFIKTTAAAAALSTASVGSSSLSNRIVITKTVPTAATATTFDEAKKQHILSAAASLARIGGGGGGSGNGGAAPTGSGTTQISLTPIANSSNLNAIGKIKTSAFLNEVEKHTLAINSQQARTQQSRPTSTLVASLNNINESTSNHQHIYSLNPVNSSLTTTSSSSAATTNATTLSSGSSGSSSNLRKPCNCTKSMCLKLYCDCFAMGAFCHDCNCVNCFNTLEHEDERNKAIKLVLDRNPQAFQSKIGKFTHVALNKFLPTSNSSSNSSNGLECIESSSSLSLKRPAIDDLDELHSRHVKGCNCKKSNCLKRYCECYLAKIQCSALCKCVGCKNCDETTRSLLDLANAAADIRNRQQQQQQHQQHQQLNPSQQQQQHHLKLVGMTKKLSSSALNSSATGHHAAAASLAGAALAATAQQPFGSLNLANRSLNSRLNFLNGVEFTSMSAKDLDKQLSI